MWKSVGCSGLVAGKSGAPRVLLTDRDALVPWLQKSAKVQDGQCSLQQKFCDYQTIGYLGPGDCVSWLQIQFGVTSTWRDECGVRQKSAARNGMGETVSLALVRAHWEHLLWRWAVWCEWAGFRRLVFGFQILQMIRSTAAFDWGDRSSWPKPFKGLVMAADVLWPGQSSNFHSALWKIACWRDHSAMLLVSFYISCYGLGGMTKKWSHLWWISFSTWMVLRFWWRLAWNGKLTRYCCAAPLPADADLRNQTTSRGKAWARSSTLRTDGVCNDPTCPCPLDVETVRMTAFNQNFLLFCPYLATSLILFAFVARRYADTYVVYDIDHVQSVSMFPIWPCQLGDVAEQWRAILHRETQSIPVWAGLSAFSVHSFWSASRV